MNLVEFIRGSGLSNSSNDEILSFMASESYVKRKPGKWTWDGLIVVFGKAAIDVVAATVKANDNLMYDLLAGAGIDLSNDQWQTAIDDIRAKKVFTSEFASALKSLGVEQVPKWTDPTPTVEDLDTAREELARLDKIAQIATAVGQATMQASGTKASVEDLKATITSILEA